MKKLKKLIAKLKKEETKYWLDRQDFEVLRVGKDSYNHRY